MSDWWKGMTCPTCGDEIVEYPALSRRDNKTHICSPCGLREAMNDWQGWFPPKEG